MNENIIKTVNIKKELNNYIETKYTPKTAVLRNGELEFETLPAQSTIPYNYMRDTVNGYIQFVPFPTFNKKGIDVIVNEEGKLINLDPSIAIADNGGIIDMIMGNVLFVKNIGEDTTGLDEKQIEFIKDYFNRAPYLMYVKGCVKVVEYDDKKC